MFCPKCGSQLVDGSKFCSKCGNAITIPNAKSVEANTDVKTENVTANNQAVKEESNKTKKEAKDKKSSSSPLLIVLVIILAIVFVGLLGVLGYKVIEQKNSGFISSSNFDDDEDEDESDDETSDDEDDADETGDLPKEDLSTEESYDGTYEIEEAAATEVAEETAPAVEAAAEEAPAAEAAAEPDDNHRSVYDIDMSAINALISTVKDNTTNDQAYNFFSNLYDNIWYVEDKYEVKDSKKKSPYTNINMKILSVEDAKDIMINTLGYDTVEGLSNSAVYIKGDKLYFAPQYLGDYWEGGAYATSELKYAGDGQYIIDAEYVHGVNTEKFVDKYRLILVENENSVFDGMAVLKMGVTANDHYLVPDCSTRVYDISEFKFKDKDTVQLAINEIFAKNGYIFTSNMEAKTYFESQSWYEPIEEGLDASDLSDTERKNIDLLSAYKKKLK